MGLMIWKKGRKACLFRSFRCVRLMKDEGQRCMIFWGASARGSYYDDDGQMKEVGAE